MMSKRLGRRFLSQPATELAPALLGKLAEERVKVF